MCRRRAGIEPLDVDVESDLREALASLGYGPEDIRSIIGRIPETGTLEERLRLALRELAPAAR